MQPIGNVADDHLVPLSAAGRIDRGEPNQPLRQPVTEGIEYSVELLFERIFGSFHRRDELVPQLGNGLAGQRADEALAAAEMVEDQRMRYPRDSGDVLQSEPLRSGAGDQGLRRLQDQPARLLRRSAQPFDPPGDRLWCL